MNADAEKYLGYLVERIHTTVLSTNGEDGYPHTSAVDMMYLDDGGIYFLTAVGKDLYRRLRADGRVSLTGIRGDDTLSSVALSLVGNVEEVGPSYLPKLLEANPYMSDIYPTEESRRALTVFRIFRGSGEWFDLSKKPIERAGFSFGDAPPHETVYAITDTCDGCSLCLESCPQSCIDTTSIPFTVVQKNCLRCGNCMSVCQTGSIVRRELRCP